ncbi:hypothetical protein C4J85_0989 [Pseudomonas sp. R4-34-07]|uniref:type II toxin-antitoxin system RelB family antitoxin n=1 Tax=Pseudomonas sp. R4-34-07 TaxID=658642 RepID=UPI000F58ADDC|nr:antitoxin [Pseudomonas sp. R4-34-07]AZF51490.1 hypothetical protein C4J85_0989 [Pseudomonas sp. R4-34-07]
MKNECFESPQSRDDDSAYDQWFRAKVQKALDDPCSGISHEEVMSEMNALIESKLSLHQAD